MAPQIKHTNKKITSVMYILIKITKSDITFTNPLTSKTIVFIVKYIFEYLTHLLAKLLRNRIYDYVLIINFKAYVY